MYLIRIGHVNTADPLGPYSTRAFPASGRRCSTFCPGGAGHARRAPPRHPRSGTVLRLAPERMSVGLGEKRGVRAPESTRRSVGERARMVASRWAAAVPPI